MTACRIAAPSIDSWRGPGTALRLYQHDDSPSVANQHATGEDFMPSDEIARKVREPSTRAPIHELGQDDLQTKIAGVLQRIFGAHRNGVKLLAQAANVNPRTAENWLFGKNLMALPAALRLMADIPEFQGEMRRLTAMESDLDPELERSLNQTMLLFMRQRR